jgi:glycosyltransferase involved in cell wall biosynthesis
MKVSVLIITYNQECFIAQAIESALMQRTNFDYEIVIGEDCSTDDTRRIVVDYQKRYPDKIRLLLPERNLGLLGKINLIQTLQACHGQYVAILEGDDYWTAQNKLQKQVDVLDAHPDYAICFHNVQAFHEDNRCHAWNLCHQDQKETSNLEDLVATNFIPTCSVMFRNGLVKQFPTWFFDLMMGDWPLHVLNAQHGKIFYIPGVMSAYRIHDGGVWAQDGVRNISEELRAYHCFDAHLGFKYSRQIERRIKYKARELVSLAYHHYSLGRYKTSRSILKLAFKAYPKMLLERRAQRLALKLLIGEKSTGAIQRIKRDLLSQH